MKKNTTIKIEGMDCTGCEASVRMLLETVPGVESVKVSFKGENADIEYDAEKASIPEDLKEILSPTNYRIR